MSHLSQNRATPENLINTDANDPGMTIDSHRWNENTDAAPFRSYKIHIIMLYTLLEMPILEPKIVLHALIFARSLGSC